MSAPQVYQVTWAEDGTVYVKARLNRVNSSHALVIVAQSDFSSIVRNVIKVSDGSVVLGPTTLTISACVLNALNTGTSWTTDSTGFNFYDALPPTAFPAGDTEYRVEYAFTLTGGEVFFLLFEGPALGRLAG